MITERFLIQLQSYYIQHIQSNILSLMLRYSKQQWTPTGINMVLPKAAETPLSLSAPAVVVCL